jgi:hypothetical protein
LHESKEDMMGSTLYHRGALAIAALALALPLALSSPRPAAAQGPLVASPGDAFSTFKDSFNLSTPAKLLANVASLRVPAGSYVVIAKLYTDIPLTPGSPKDIVKCDLSAGTDFDRVWATHDFENPFANLSLNVVHRFVRPGRVFLNCGSGDVPGMTTLHYIKITAISMKSLSNVPSL